MTDRIERRLLFLAATFLVLQAVILSLSPAVREKSWSVEYRLSHWIGLLAWMAVVATAQRLAARSAPGRDPFLIPLSALLSGWGILTIWRLDAGLGLRQALWLAVSVGAAALLVRHLGDLAILRRYKYLLLGGGLVVATLTIFLGTSPTGAGPRLWLSCCGLYLQPSEPLKLLLVVYLSAYLADQVSIRARIFPLFVPTVLVTALALVLLTVQRDLGTASLFIGLYTLVLFLATGRRRVLLAAAVALALAALTGYFFVDLVQARLEAWLNPWNDPSGRSYQIIQSLLSIASGGILGRGLGLGSPGLVPVAQSDFVYSSIAEESGLIGSFGLLAAYGLLLERGFLIALRSSQRFHRILAASLTTYLGLQALLIIGGDLRLLPLTGVTLPFVSYGGSSLLTAFAAIALLIIISSRSEDRPASIVERPPYTALAVLLGLGIVAAALTQSWWTLVRGPDLLARTDNPRRSIADRYVPRGNILDRNNSPIAETQGVSGSFERAYLYPQLGAVIGYTHPRFGQAGLEDTLDGYLRGLQGNPAGMLFWDQVLYGTPPPGLDVRLSIDLALQAQADHLLADFRGAAVMMDAQSGEILAMASHPAYDPNALDSIGSSLARDEGRPLLNRAAQGVYPADAAARPFKVAAEFDAVATNAPNLYRRLGFYDAPEIRLPVARPIGEIRPEGVQISPLQMAVAACALANGGLMPAPRIALAVNTPQQGWIVLPALGTSRVVFTERAAQEATRPLVTATGTAWQWLGSATSSGASPTWYVGGTLPDWQGTPLSLVVILETDDTAAARRIGEALLAIAIAP